MHNFNLNLTPIAPASPPDEPSWRSRTIVNLTPIAPASPPDVSSWRSELSWTWLPSLRLRRPMWGEAMPRRPTLNPEWAAPSVWALPQVLMGQARTRGAAPNLSEAERRGIASPHIGRRSRSRQPL